jgi:hypothetical protein
MVLDGASDPSWPGATAVRLMSESADGDLRRLEAEIASGGKGIVSLARRVTGWIAALVSSAAHGYAAATVYEELSRLSDAELRRRGLSRTTLAQHISAALRPPAGPH